MNIKRYEYLKNSAIGKPVYEDVKRRALGAEGENIIESPLSGPMLSLEWLHIGQEPHRLCGIWFYVYLMKYSLISRNCFSCWKLVVRFDSIKQLYAVKELMEHQADERGWHSKCGTEQRPYCFQKGRYAGFWYCDLKGTLADARERGALLKKDLEPLGLADNVILKRGCTEMEMNYGPSRNWVYPQKMHEFEDELDKLFQQHSDRGSFQPAWIKELIELNWLEYALDTRDPDIGEYVGEIAKARATVQSDNYLGNSLKPQSGWVARGKIGNKEKDNVSEDKGSEEGEEQPRVQLV